MKPLAALLLILIASCATKAIVVDPIAPRAVVVAEKVKRASASAATLHTTVSDAHKQSSAIVTEMATIQAETDRLSRKAALEPSDFDALKAMEAAHFQSIFAHELTMRNGVAQSVTVQADTQSAEKEAVEMIPAAKATDANTAAITAKAAVDKTAADKWRALKSILIVGAVILIVGGGFLLYLRLT